MGKLVTYDLGFEKTVIVFDDATVAGPIETLCASSDADGASSAEDNARPRHHRPTAVQRRLAGTNYHVTCRGRSRPDFVAKPAIVEEEPDENGYWLELTIETQLPSAQRISPLPDEADELTAIVTATRKTTARTGK